MELEYSGSLRSRRRPEELAKMLSDESTVARLIPGCKRVYREGHEYVAELLISAGPIRGDVTMRWSARKTQGGIEIVGRAVGIDSSLTFLLSLDIGEAGEGSTVKWAFKGRLEGLASLLDKRIVDRIAGSYINEMVKRLAEI